MELSADFVNDLVAEAERIARRHRAQSVSLAYVQTAADRLSLCGRNSAADEVILSLSALAFGVATGFLSTLAVGSQPIAGWLTPAAMALALVSAAGTGVGATRKLLR